ncbi:jg15225, partial [Pararge aegeria aegeria]
EFSSQSDSSSDLQDVDKNENGDESVQKYIGKCRALYTYEARLDDELTLSPG